MRNVNREYLQLQLQILDFKFCVGLLYNVYKRVTNYTLLYLYLYWACNVVALRTATEGKFFVFVSFLHISL